MRRDVGSPRGGSIDEGTRADTGVLCSARQFVAEVPMRLWFVLALATLGLVSGCGSSPPPAQTTVVVPPGSTVVCPTGSPGVLSGGVYRC